MEHYCLSYLPYGQVWIILLKQTLLKQTLLKQTLLKQTLLKQTLLKQTLLKQTLLKQKISFKMNLILTNFMFKYIYLFCFNERE